MLNVISHFSAMCDRYGRRAFPALVAALTSCAVLAVMFIWGGFRWNMTASVPLGLYRVTNDPNARYVEVCPQGIAEQLSTQRNYRPKGRGCSDGFLPMLKPVAAKPGDTVVSSARFFTVNGKPLPNTRFYQFDGGHRPMPHAPYGTFTVAPQTLWLLSTYNDHSFDSRYFGPISEKEVIGYAEPVWTY